MNIGNYRRKPLTWHHQLRPRSRQSIICVSLSVCLCVSVSLPLSLSLSFFLSVSFSLFLSFSLSLSVFLSFSLLAGLKGHSHKSHKKRTFGFAWRPSSGSRRSLRSAARASTSLGRVDSRDAWTLGLDGC